MTRTISERLSETGGRPTGFDYMRLALACAIVCWHSIVTSHGPMAQERFGASQARPVIAILLPMFFALSGFLVAGSLERCRTVGSFLGLRAIRIYPALAVESLICALILGPMLTTLPLGAYYTSPVFRAYFLNILGIPHFLLPGVFTTSPFPQVNGQLWTIPYELQCYIALAILGALGVVRRRTFIVVGTLAFTAFMVLQQTILSHGRLGVVSGAVPGWLLVTGFLWGVACYLYRDRLPWSAALGWGSLVLGLALMAIPYGEIAAVPLLSYVTVYFGLLDPPKTGFLKGADLSYGIFLYSFPIQQTIMYLAPWARHWWINIALALPSAALVAAVSWRFIEKPALSLRKPLQRLEASMLERGALRRSVATKAAPSEGAP
jgi:peptidoglycan/LPS O-acetylase OafA/YrhL